MYYGCNVHSSDEIRKELFGYYSEENNAIVFDTLQKRVVADLKNGKDVVYDATNLSRRKRIGFLNNISHIKCKKICILKYSDFQTCVERNSVRSNTIPNEILYQMRKNFCVPIKEEGWDEVFIVDGTNQNKEWDVGNLLVKLHDYKQDSKFHIESLGQHLIDAFCYAIKNDFSYEVQIAAALHDIGKPFCKTFGEDGEAHYYQHANISSYEAIAYLLNFYELTQEQVVYIANLIGMHMKSFYYEANSNWQDINRTLQEDSNQLQEIGKKMLSRDMKLHGVKTIIDLIHLHIADLNASKERK